MLQSEYLAATQQERTRWLRPSPLSLDRGPLSPPPSARRHWRGTLICSRTYIGKLEAEGVIQRQGDGFPLDQGRVAYLRYLRRERKQSPRGDANADFQRAKSELIRLRIAEKQRQLISLDEAISTTDEMIGLVLTHMSGMAARCAGPDLALRRKIDRVVYETRVAISEAATKLADQRGEPPLDEQG